MKRQRNCSQLKYKASENIFLNGTEINNLPNKEFKALKIKISTTLGKGINEHSEIINELETIKTHPVRYEEFNSQNKICSRKNE